MNSEQEILDASILIVDDQESDVQLLEQMLHDADYRCITSTMDPLTVCDLHRANHYDLILLDIQMPGMDGFQVMKRLKEIETGGYLPVIVITANLSHRLLALASGAKDFISKPFDLMETMTRIHNILEVRLLYSKLENSKQVLESLALHDALTGLPNRRLLMDRLSSAIVHAHRNKQLMAVLYLDLDGFKQINDSLGHDAGDTLLTMVADRLLAAVRQEDTVARFGGDEFLIVLRELNHGDGVEKPVSKVIHDVSKPFRIQGQNVTTSTSIGVSIYPLHGDDAEALIRSADMALYEAKRAGKNGYCIGKRAASACINQLVSGILLDWIAVLVQTKVGRKKG